MPAGEPVNTSPPEDPPLYWPDANPREWDRLRNHSGINSSPELERLTSPHAEQALADPELTTMARRWVIPLLLGLAAVVALLFWASNR